jgi:hypothetical protein
MIQLPAFAVRVVVECPGPSAVEALIREYGPDRLNDVSGFSHSVPILSPALDTNV